jgi:UDP-3-O-[3-hydroxymyristoyl] glucosamine N-acyltransferase
MKLHEIASHLDCQIVGDPHTEITGVATIESASPGTITFFNNIRYRKYLASTLAAAVILEKAADLPSHLSGLISPYPYLTFAQALALFSPELKAEPEIHPMAVVSPSAKLGRGVSIGPFSIVDEGVTLGNGVTILTHCHIYANATIGASSFIHSHATVREGCLLGERVILKMEPLSADGWLRLRTPPGQFVAQNSTQRAMSSWKMTPRSERAQPSTGLLWFNVVRRGTKIDNLVQIGHGSAVGEDTLLCAQVGLAGSRIGNRVILSGPSRVAGHLRIGDGVIATAQSGILTQCRTAD